MQNHVTFLKDQNNVYHLKKALKCFLKAAFCIYWLFVFAYQKQSETSH